MSAYLIVNIEITDPARYAEYVKVVPQTLEKYGAKYLARGGKTLKLEGDWEPKRVVVLEFESVDRALEWYECDDYAAPKAMRQAASVTQMVLVEGV